MLRVTALERVSVSALGFTTATSLSTGQTWSLHSFLSIVVHELEGMEWKKGGFRTHIWKGSSACGGHVTAQVELLSNVLNLRTARSSAW